MRETKNVSWMTNDNQDMAAAWKRVYSCSEMKRFEKRRTSSAGLAKLLEALLDVGHDVRVCVRKAN